MKSGLACAFPMDRAIFLLVRYEPRNNRDAPVLRWLDDDQLSVDLGEVTWLTPQIDHLGHVRISYTYSGAVPSLE